MGDHTFLNTKHIIRIRCDRDYKGHKMCQIWLTGDTYQVNEEDSPGVYQDVKKYYDKIKSEQYNYLYKDEKDRKKSVFRHLCLD